MTDKIPMGLYALMAFPLSFLGLPLYLHLPKYYHDTYGSSLAALGIILFFSRMLDATIDPMLGIFSDRYHLTQKKYFVVFGMGLAFFFNAFFHVPLGQSPLFILSWFAVCTVFVYVFFSLIFINYYNLGLHLIRTKRLRIHLSSFREFSSFLGILTASILPSALFALLGDEDRVYGFYGICFLIFILIALLFLPKENQPLKVAMLPKSTLLKDFSKKISHVYRSNSMKWLLILFFLNSLPVSITANLFNFYVETTLASKSLAPYFLSSYFLSAAFGAAYVSFACRSLSKTQTLVRMMILSALSFSVACFLDENSAAFFYSVCVVSGFGLGGELVILPAIAADVLNKKLDYGNTFFGIWSSCSKISLGLAAGIFLPLVSGAFHSLDGALLQHTITFFYAGIPLLIKVSLILLFIYIIIPNLEKDLENEKN